MMKSKPYTTVIDGKEYAIVRLPLGNRKYKKKVKLLSLLHPEKNAATKWAWSELDKFKRKSEPHSFSDLAEWYEENFLVAPEYDVNGKQLFGLRTWRAQRTVLAQLTDYFRDFDLSDMTVSVLERYKRRELKTILPATLNRRFALMRTMFKKAMQRKMVRENPFDLGGRLIEISLESGRESPLTKWLVMKLLARSRKSEQELLYYVLSVLANTGARPSEVFPWGGWKDDMPMEPLTWDRILKYDFKAMDIVSYKGRSRFVRVVPALGNLSSVLKEFYDKTKPNDTDLLFNVTTFKRSWATLCRSVGVKGVRMRDFRHYVNAYLLDKVSDMERMKIMGHRSMTTNARYTKLDTNAIDRIRKVCV